MKPLRLLYFCAVSLLPAIAFAIEDASVEPFTVSQMGKFVSCGFKYSVTNAKGKTVQGNIYDTYKAPLQWKKQWRDQPKRPRGSHSR